MLIKLKDLPHIRKKHKGKIVFLRGSFDLIHGGHVVYLKWAKALGNVLVVALAQDRDLEIRKGKGRPVLPLPQRLAVMDSMRYVDYVLPLPASATKEQNKNATLKILNLLRPDIFVTPYTVWKKSAKKIKEEFGTEIRYFLWKPINSTTSMIAKAASIHKHM